MERPTKRPRSGPAPLDDGDPDADELVSRPEEVNARRDPFLQLERSRAAAALRLKSSFERIFEKYGRDFTGVGDEIDLRTGEIVVDNGHLQSLQDVEIGAADGADEDGQDDQDDQDAEDARGRGHAASDPAPSLNGDESSLLGRAGQPAPHPTFPLVGAPPMFGAGWPGPAPFAGAPPGFSVMYPGQMPYGGFPMHYGAPLLMPSTDPAWRVPELPSPFFGNAATPERAAEPVRKKARLSVTAAREHGVDDEEDEILLGASSGGQGTETGGDAVMRTKPLTPQRVLDKTTPASKKKRPAAASAGRGRKTGDRSKDPQHGGTPSMDKKSPGNKRPTSQPATRASEAASSDPHPKPKTRVGDGEPRIKHMPAADPKGTAESDSQKEDTLQQDEGVAVEAQHSREAATATTLTPQPEDPDVYVDLSGEKARLAKKPRNQSLLVEIAAKKLPDARSFRVLTPEPSEAESAGPKGNHDDKRPPSDGLAAGVPTKAQNPENADLAQQVPVESLSRNVVDPAYAFSDEDEPTVPRNKTPQGMTNEANKATEPNRKVPRQARRDADSETASSEPNPTADEPLMSADDSASVRPPSPSLSVQLDDGPADLPRADAEEAGRLELAAKSPEDSSNRNAPISERTPKRKMTRRKSMRGAGKPPILQSSSRPSTPAQPEPQIVEQVASKKRRHSSSSKAQPQVTPASTASMKGFRPSSLVEEPTNQETPQTSFETEAAANPPPPSKGPSAPVLEIPDSDPPVPSQDRLQSDSSQHSAVSSPALADPARPKQPQPSRPPAPSTPVKTPRNRTPKTKRQPASRPSQPSTATACSTTTTTTIRKRRGILSLLPPDDDDEDELSILSPSSSRRPGRASETVAIRSSPATHHLRFALLGSAPRARAGGAAGNEDAGTPSGRKGRSETGTGTGRGRGRGRRRSTAGTTPSSRRIGDEPVQTPGGTMRRCGEDGFRCERDFCFACF